MMARTNAAQSAATIHQSGWLALFLIAACYGCQDVAFRSNLECTWPSSEGSPILPVTPIVDMQQRTFVKTYSPFNLHLEIYGPANLTAEWRIHDIIGADSDELNPSSLKVIHMLTETDEARPCWHGFSVKVDSALPAAFGQHSTWTVSITQAGCPSSYVYQKSAWVTIEEFDDGNCSATGYCLHGGTCVAENNQTLEYCECSDDMEGWPCDRPPRRCLCQENYRGEQCELYCEKQVLDPGKTNVSVNLGCPLNVTLNCPGGYWEKGDSRVGTGSQLLLQKAAVDRGDKFEFSCKQTHGAEDTTHFSLQVHYPPYIKYCAQMWNQQSMTPVCPISQGFPQSNNKYKWEQISDGCYGICNSAVTANMTYVRHACESIRKNKEKDCVNPDSTDQTLSFKTGLHYLPFLCRGCYRCSLKNDFFGIEKSFDILFNPSGFCETEEMAEQFESGETVANFTKGINLHIQNQSVELGGTVVLDISVPAFKVSTTVVVWSVGARGTIVNNTDRIAVDNSHFDETSCRINSTLKIVNVTDSDFRSYYVTVTYFNRYNLEVPFPITLTEKPRSNLGSNLTSTMITIIVLSILGGLAIILAISCHVWRKRCKKTSVITGSMNETDSLLKRGEKNEGDPPAGQLRRLGTPLDMRALKALAEPLGPHWRDLALELQVPQTDIEAHEYDNPRSCQRAAEQMLTKWFKSVCTDDSCSWTIGQLRQKLCACDLVLVKDEWLKVLTERGYISKSPQPLNCDLIPFARDPDNHSVFESPQESPTATSMAESTNSSTQDINNDEDLARREASTF